MRNKRLIRVTVKNGATAVFLPHAFLNDSGYGHLITLKNGLVLDKDEFDKIMSLYYAHRTVPTKKAVTAC